MGDALTTLPFGHRHPNGWKSPVRVLIDQPVDTGAGGLDPLGTAKYDRYVTLEDGMRVLLPMQSDPVQNGIWIARNASWERAEDWSAGDRVAGAVVAVCDANENGNGSITQGEPSYYSESVWMCSTPNADTIVDSDPAFFACIRGNAWVVDAWAGDQDNYSPVGYTQATGAIYVTPDTDRKIFGLAGVTQWFDRTVYFTNLSGGAQIVFSHEAPSSDPEKRFSCPLNSDYGLKPGCSVVLRYDGRKDMQRWRIYMGTP